jgi:hypothetical protein
MTGSRKDIPKSIAITGTETQRLADIRKVPDCIQTLLENELTISLEQQPPVSSAIAAFKKKTWRLEMT